jgi:hypothetical protein
MRLTHLQVNGEIGEIEEREDRGGVVEWLLRNSETTEEVQGSLKIFCLVSHAGRHKTATQLI